MLRAAFTSSLVMSAGDLCCQTIQKRHRLKKQGFNVRAVETWHKEVDWRRTGTFALVGLSLHGPFFYKGFRWLDNICGNSKSLYTAAVKTMIGQVTIFPLYVASFFAYTSLLEGKSWNQSVARSKSMFWPTYQAGSVFWPVVNVVNFMVIPPTQRILYVNVAGLLWNSYLSWTNSRKSFLERVL